jgi:hypothetical protein
MEKGLEIPPPRKLRGKSRPVVGLPSVIADAKVELYIALRDAGMRKTELARRMGIHKQQVERLLDIDHSSRLDQLEPAFAAIGKGYSFWWKRPPEKDCGIRATAVWPTYRPSASQSNRPRSNKQSSC